MSVSVSLDLVERYLFTMFDLWRMGSKRFLSYRESVPGRYLSPYQFISISTAAIFGLLLVAFALNNAGLKRSGVPVFDDPGALAARVLMFLLTCLLGNTLLAVVFSRFWPTKKRSSFNQIFNFNCYYFALLLPFGMLDVIFTPVLVELAVGGAVPEWVALIPLALGGMAGIVIFFCYWIPGIAFINEVSIKDTLISLVVWPNLIAFFVGLSISIAVNRDEFAKQVRDGYDRGFRAGYEWGTEMRHRLKGEKS